MLLSYSVSEPIKSHVDGSIFFSVPLIMLFAAALPVATCVVGCWWPIYARAFPIDVDIWKFSNNLPNSDSVDNATTLFIMPHSTCTGPFSVGIDCIGVLDFDPRKKYPPDLICAYGS